MNDWNANDDAANKAKKLATYKLCERLDKDADPKGIRDACRNDPKAARDALRQAGDFINMPADLPVYVCEENAQDRGKVVAIVLPAKGQMPTFDAFDFKKTWICTWTPYAQILQQALKPGTK